MVGTGFTNSWFQLGNNCDHLRLIYIYLCQISCIRQRGNKMLFRTSLKKLQFPIQISVTDNEVLILVNVSNANCYRGRS